jgi:metal-sulfur cluster biosynthetic enzyme
MYDTESQNQLETAILEHLKKVIDPETGADILRMRLVEDLHVGADGQVSYTFHPSSPLCPIAVYLVTEIKAAVASVNGVSSQKITVTGYVVAEELSQLINKETKPCGSQYQ